MKLSLFEYAVLLHPEFDKDGKPQGKTEIIVHPTQLLAKDAQQVGMLAARAVPEAHIDHLDRVEVIVRPF